MTRSGTLNDKARRRIRKFNPGTFQSDEEVMEQFVVRRRELDSVLDTLSGNVDSPSCQHVVVVAPRGRGKTMLLARVAAELRSNRALSTRLLPVRFMEESQEIFNLADFWLETLFHLARECARQDPQYARDLQRTHETLSANWRDSSLADRARAAVLDAADRMNRKLVLMVENLQSLCEDVEKDFGWQLRKSLQVDSQIILLGSATSYFEGLEDAEQPFFELFRIINLEPLETDDCRRLWRAVSGDTVTGREIRPLEILTGGSPRLLVIVAGFARHRSLHRLMEELVSLIDEHTEYFRGHLEVLGKTERRVYVSLLDLWQPSSAGEIAARSRLDVRAVSTMLGRLAKRGVVVPAPAGTGARRVYAAAERLYSIYYKLRRERDEAAVVQNLIRFMAAFYTTAELADMSEKLAAEASQSPMIGEGVGRAIVEFPEVEKLFTDAGLERLDPRADVSRRIASLDPRNRMEGILSSFRKRAYRTVIGSIDALIASRPGKWLKAPNSLLLVLKARAYEELGELDAAIAVYDDAVGSLGRWTAADGRSLVVPVMIGKGDACVSLGQLERAVEVYDRAISLERDGDGSAAREHVALAMEKKADTQSRLGKSNEAIATYLALVDTFSTTHDPSLLRRVSMALVNVGKEYEKLDDPEGAIAAYEQLTDKFRTNPNPVFQGSAAAGLLRKGDVYRAQRAHRPAISAYGEAIRLLEKCNLEELLPYLAGALYLKACSLDHAGDADAALSACDKLIDRFETSDVVQLQDWTAFALFQKGVIQARSEKFNAAIESFDKVVARIGDSDSANRQRLIAQTLDERASAQKGLGDFASAIASYREIVSRSEAGDAPEQNERIARVIRHIGDVYLELQDEDAAIAVYDDLVERFIASDEVSVNRWVVSALVEKGRACSAANRTDAAVESYDRVVTRFGACDDPQVRNGVAMALYEKGRLLADSGDFASAIAAYDDVAQRFRTSDEPSLLVWVAIALVLKATALALSGESGKAALACQAVLDEFGSSGALEIQAWLARALANKGRIEIQLNRAEDAIRTCTALEDRLDRLTEDEKPLFRWDLLRIRTHALLLREQVAEAIESFSSLYDAFETTNAVMIQDLVQIVSQLLAGGVSTGEVCRILRGNESHARAIQPLIVALESVDGQVVRAPAEVVDVAEDVQKEILDWVESRVSL